VQASSADVGQRLGRHGGRTFDPVDVNPGQPEKGRIDTSKRDGDGVLFPSEAGLARASRRLWVTRSRRRTWLPDASERALMGLYVRLQHFDSANWPDRLLFER
jgi:hypothetical protein